MRIRRLIIFMSTLAAIAATAGPCAAALAAADGANFQITSGATGFASGGTLEAPPLRTRWTVALGTAATSYPLVADGRVFVVAYDSPFHAGTLYALDADTGAILWARATTGDAQIAYEDGRLFVVDATNIVLAVSPATGAPLWVRTVHIASLVQTPLADSGTLYVSSDWGDGWLYAIDERDGSTRWQASIDTGGRPVVDGRFVYFSDWYLGVTVAYDRDDGSRAWRGSTTCLGSGGAMATGAYLVGGIGGRCGAVADTASGGLLDTFGSDRVPAAAGDVAVTVVGTTMQARSLRTGVLLWRFTGDGALGSSPVIVNETVYVGSETGTLFAVDLRTGAQVWSGDAAPDGGTPGGAGMTVAGALLVAPARGTISALESARSPRPGLDLRVTSGPDGPTTATSATVTFGSSAPEVPLTCRFDAGAWLACDGAMTFDDLPDGPHTFEVRAHDPDGGVVALAARGWSVDTTAPTATIVRGPSGSLASPGTMSFTVSDDDNGNGRLACRLDGGPWEQCQGFIAKPYTVGVGAHRFEVRATDALGNTQSVPTSRTWVVDTTPPVTTLRSGPADPTTATTATFTFSADEPATLYCTLDYAQVVPCASPLTVTGLAAGPHTFTVTATDDAGNRELEPLRAEWTVTAPPDLTAPDTRVTAGPPALTTATSGRFSFDAGEPVQFSCRLDGGAWEACDAPDDVFGLADGDHELDVRATDGAGNADASPAAWTWTVDTRPPQTRAALAPGSGPTAGYAFTMSADEPGASFECELDYGAWTRCAPGVTYAAMAAGTHVLRVRATDAAGNTDAAPTAVTFDAPAAARPAPAAQTQAPAPAIGRPLMRIPPAAIARMLADDTAALLRSSTRRTLRARPAVAFRAGEPARLAVTVTAREHGRTFTFARAQSSFTAAGARSVRLRLTDAGRRRLARRGRLSLRIRATVTPVAGAAASARATARV